MQERLVRLFEDYFGCVPNSVVSLSGDGSNRSYRRLVSEDGLSAIGAVGPDREENRAFLSFTRSFRSVDLPVPELFAANEDSGIYLIEDLGDVTLFSALEDAREAAGGEFPASLVAVYRQVIGCLPRFQVEGHRVADYSVAYPHAEFDRRSITWDLNYFKYHFLKLAKVSFNESRLERDFDTLTGLLLNVSREFFLYRDFQSRNVMLAGGEPRFIDYQGGRRGALQYDVASLLYDAKAGIPKAVRDELLQHYLTQLETLAVVDRTEFTETLPGFVIIRIAQALGAYGYRGFFERKPRFLQSVPFAARNLAALLADGLPVSMPELESVFGCIADAWGSEAIAIEDDPRLTVLIRSFSYARGYPEDRSGHGGGYVFDCRAIPNPGRQPQFELLTGLDAAVAEHLTNVPEATVFLDHATGLSLGQVDEYRRRGFDYLSVSFGCTGGQHRSVYFAERLAERVRAACPDVRVVLEHRERPMWPGGAGNAARPSPSTGF
ncbi:MAG: phosphotransferase enzyme family protein [Gemmatimonadales bacterium]|nr:MAG: phosphotransferase enzyme family protein [Gemmatimonadales bacterium]